MKRPAWIVEVEGVPKGWTVRLRNSNGNLIDETKSSPLLGPFGTVKLVVAPSLIDLIAEPRNKDWLIISNGIIEVYDENGKLVFRKRLPLVVGGDKYLMIMLD